MRAKTSLQQLFVVLILTRYPDLKSIKDLGSVLQSPWKKAFFTLLLGQERSLDDVEHGLIRAPGVFNGPRIHAAVNCASIGCPMLRNEAFTADQLDKQLEDSMRHFLADRSRNHFDAAGNTLSVSKIFDWYRGDFEKGYQGFTSLDVTLAAALSGQSRLAGRAALKTWVFAILKNKIVDHLRLRQRTATITSLVPDDDDHDDFAVLFDRKGFWRPDERPKPGATRKPLWPSSSSGRCSKPA